MTCASVTIRLRGLMYVNLVSQSVTYVSGTFVTLDSGLNREAAGGAEPIRAPTFTLPNLQGQPVSLGEQKGKVVLLNFWATWCKDCVSEMPELEKLYQRFRSQGLSLLAIALDKEGQPAVEAFLKNKYLSLSYPILLDPAGLVPRSYRLSWVPVTIVIGRDGTIVENILGARPWGSEEVMNSFEQVLNTRGND